MHDVDSIQCVVCLLVANGSFRAAARVCKTCHMVRGLSSNLGNFIAIHFLSLKTEVIHSKLPPFDGNAALFLHLKRGVHDFCRKTFAPPSCGGFHCDAFHCAFGCLLARLMSPSEQLPWSQVLQSRVVDKLVGVLTYVKSI